MAGHLTTLHQGDPTWAAYVQWMRSLPPGCVVAGAAGLQQQLGWRA